MKYQGVKHRIISAFEHTDGTRTKMVKLHHADAGMHDRRTRDASADRGRSHVENCIDLGRAVFLRRHYDLREIE